MRVHGHRVVVTKTGPGAPLPSPFLPTMPSSVDPSMQNALGVRAILPRPEGRGLSRIQIKVDVAIENAFTDIVAERFDAGVRLGGAVAKGMIAMPIGPELRMVAVAAPSYLAGRAPPRKPQDLTEQVCVNLRLSARSGVYAWEFEKRGREFRVRVDGQFTVNGIAPMLLATLDGCGVGYLPLDLVQPHLDKGNLVALLPDWTAPFAGYHLYYPSRREPTAAFKVLLDTLRFPRPA